MHGTFQVGTRLKTRLLGWKHFFLKMINIPTFNKAENKQSLAECKIIGNEAPHDRHRLSATVLEIFQPLISLLKSPVATISSDLAGGHMMERIAGRILQRLALGMEAVGGIIGYIEQLQISQQGPVQS